MADPPAVDDPAYWPVETIPPEDSLYLRFHRQWLQDGELSTGLFVDKDGGMSTDWAKHATAEGARGRAKRPSDNGVAVLRVRPILAIPQQVLHAPIRVSDHSRTPPILPNRAHTNVVGDKTPEVRLKLSRIAMLLIHPDAPIEEKLVQD